MERRQLGNSDIQVSPVALGCWPISGMTSIEVNDRDSVETIAACFDLGINFLDTAYCYGAQGESERLIARAIAGRRDELVIATKGGIHWLPNGDRVLDATPARLTRECEESLERLATDRIDLLYLHAPDPNTPVSESAGALKRLMEAGKTRSVGASNLTLAQLKEFQAACPLAAYQPPYNMLQREIEAESVPWCQAQNVSLVIYWPLMKGLLAGKLPRNFEFKSGDGRRKYPMFHGEEWEKNQDFLDELRTIAAEVGKSVAQVVINWTIHRPGITAALCGAKRAEQIRDNAGGMNWQLSPVHLQRIGAAIARRGPIVSRAAV